MNLIDIFKEICLEKDYNFEYGTKKFINIMNFEDVESDKVNVLLLPYTRGALKNFSRTTTGSLLFVVKDENDGNYDIKYTKILPLISKLDDFEKKLKNCNGIDVVSFTSLDAVEELDVCLTGLFVNFVFEVYE